MKPQNQKMCVVIIHSEVIVILSFEENKRGEEYYLWDFLYLLLQFVR